MFFQHDSTHCFFLLLGIKSSRLFQIIFDSFGWKYSYRGVDQNPTLLVICLSGFRPDFLGQATTPTLFHLKACGVSAPFLRPVFPTNTLPNQHTIATGLYPESHGIVDDLFRDRETAKVFDGRRGVPTTTGSQFNDPAWWKGEPIWMTTKRQGKRAFLYHWAGSEVLLIHSSKKK